MIKEQGIHLVMPMGGSGSRFSQRGFSCPKPLLTIQDAPFFYWATQSLAKYIQLKSLTFVVLQEHVQEFQIERVIHQYYPEAQICVLQHVLKGAVLTCMEGVKHLDNTAPIIFNDCDHIFRCHSFEQYCQKSNFAAPDGALLTFESADPKFSYVKLGKAGQVEQTVEKQVVSNQAICGAYYFRNRQVFEDAVEKYLDECSYDEFFVSGVYNVLSKQKADLRSFPVDMHIAFGTPEEYDEALAYTTEFDKLR